MNKNKIQNIFRELTGVRIVGMYIQEFFHWGFQKYDHENDDGIDGEIIIRDKHGNDMGCRIFVQIKSGPSYISSINNTHINIAAYSGDQYKKHQDAYGRMVEPVILVYVNSEKKINGKKKEDLIYPNSWWIQLNNYKCDDTFLYKIPISQKFGSHSKGYLFKLVRPLLNNWNHYPEIIADISDKKIYYSLNLKQDARHFYNVWSETDSLLGCNNDIKVHVTRIGWRHINKGSRQIGRRANSLKLISIARKIIEENGTKLIPLQERTPSQNTKEIKYGLRSRINIDNQALKVQVVIRRWVNVTKNIDKYWFYSVHLIR